MTAVIPPRKKQRYYDKYLYKLRHPVENASQVLEELGCRFDRSRPFSYTQLALWRLSGGGLRVPGKWQRIAE